MTADLHVFVYGALMDHPLALERGRAGRIADHAVGFVAPGLAVLEPRFLGLYAAPGSTAHGVVVAVTADEWERMAAHESGYDRVELEAEVGGETVAVTALVLRAKHVAAEAWPSRRYAAKLVRGAEKAGLPEAVVAHYREARRRGSPFTLWLSPLTWPIRKLTPVLGFEGAVAAVAVGLVLVWAALVYAVR
ncbi:MAG: gamma-glutamylcyclotransferase [Alphaproteobacteria bacterium]|nr:gamma-glutamylcyclotransferase [Alphaproteobacteria bacterium]